MNNLTLFFFSFVAGSAFGIWPNIAAQAKITSSWLILIMGIALFCTGVIVKLFSGSGAWQLPHYLDLRTVAIACAINCVGYLAYGPLVMASKQLGTTTFIVIAVALSVAITYLYGVAFLKEPVSTPKMCGIIIILAGIVLVKMK